MKLPVGSISVYRPCLIQFLVCGDVSLRVCHNAGVSSTRGSEMWQMSVTLLKALAASVPACLLFYGSMVLFLRERTAWCVLQVVGAGGLVVVILTHICEALQVLPWMGWGLENALGHYVDLSTAILGVTLFPIGYFLHALKKQPA